MQYHDSFLPPVNTLPWVESRIIELTLSKKKATWKDGFQD